MTQRNTRRGFTLIELLVVVLIIGILAAIAVPQYQKAVWKSRFVQTKLLAKSIHDAEEVYHLSNGNYTFDFSKLDLQVSNGCENSNSKCTFSGGYCELSTNTNSSDVSCYLYKNQETYMAYTWFFKDSKILQTWSAGKERYCIAFTNNSQETSYQICQSETGTEPVYSTSDESGWAYPFN